MLVNSGDNFSLLVNSGGKLSAKEDCGENTRVCTVNSGEIQCTMVILLVCFVLRVNSGEICERIRDLHDSAVNSGEILWVFLKCDFVHVNSGEILTADWIMAFRQSFARVGRWVPLHRRR